MATNLVISSPTEMWRFSAEDIMYIEAEGNYSQVYFGNGEKELITQQLGKIEERIGNQITNAESPLIRIGKSLIINRQHIYHITKNELKLRSDFGKTFTINASKDALLQLKKLMEREAK